jgi:hypothetical protein
MSLSTVLKRSIVLTKARGGLSPFSGTRALSTRVSDLERPVQKDNILPVSISDRCIVQFSTAHAHTYACLMAKTVIYRALLVIIWNVISHATHFAYCVP